MRRTAEAVGEALKRRLTRAVGLCASEEHADVRHLAKVKVAGSRPVTRSMADWPAIRRGVWHGAHPDNLRAENLSAACVLTERNSMKHELECGHKASVKPANGCTWCPICNAMMVVRDAA